MGRWAQRPRQGPAKGAPSTTPQRNARGASHGKPGRSTGEGGMRLAAASARGLPCACSAANTQQQNGGLHAKALGCALEQAARCRGSPVPPRVDARSVHLQCSQITPCQRAPLQRPSAPTGECMRRAPALPATLASPHTRLPRWELSVSLRLARAARDSRSRVACDATTPPAPAAHTMLSSCRACKRKETVAGGHA